MESKYRDIVNPEGLSKDEKERMYTRRIMMIDFGYAGLIVLSFIIVVLLQDTILMMNAILFFGLVTFISNMIIYIFARKTIKFSMRADLALDEIDEIEKEWSVIQNRLSEIGVDLGTVNGTLRSVTKEIEDRDTDKIVKGALKIVGLLERYGDSQKHGSPKDINLDELEVL